MHVFPLFGLQIEHMAAPIYLATSEVWATLILQGRAPLLAQDGVPKHVVQNAEAEQDYAFV